MPRGGHSVSIVPSVPNLASPASLLPPPLHGSCQVHANSFAHVNSLCAPLATSFAPPQFVSPLLPGLDPHAVAIALRIPLLPSPVPHLWWCVLSDRPPHINPSLARADGNRSEDDVHSKADGHHTASGFWLLHLPGLHLDGRCAGVCFSTLRGHSHGSHPWSASCQCAALMLSGQRLN